jgi:hypothetical protein
VCLINSGGPGVFINVPVREYRAINHQIFWRGEVSYSNPIIITSQINTLLSNCWLENQFSIHTVIAQHIWCYSELCDRYSVQFSIHTAIAQHIWYYSELCDCYTVQFSIHTAIAQHIWCYSVFCDCCSIQFSVHTIIAVLTLSGT